MSSSANRPGRRPSGQYRIWRIGGLIGLAALLSLAPMWIGAQIVTASVSGTVTDPQGAVIPGAKVTLTNVQNGTVLTTTSNGTGFYNFPQVSIGQYTLSVTSPGFETASIPKFTLQLNQAARMDVSMKVGQVSQTVQVTAAAPLLQTRSSQLNTVISSKAVSHLPLASDNYVQLTLLAPGATQPNPATMLNTYSMASSFGDAGRPYINGNREQENTFQLDGMESDQASDNLVGYTPSTDAIQEFSEMTSNPPAQYGNFMGGVISTAIKSGTNAFHGDLFETLGNDKLDANSWANNFSGAPRNKFRWNQYGGAIGGPIVANHLFFFADYQQNRYNIPSAANFTGVWDAAMRGGNFSEFGVPIYNPATGAPFPNATIPTSQEDAAAAALLNNTALYPLPNNPAGTVATNNNYEYFSKSYINTPQGDVKLDWAPAQSDHLFARYSYSMTNNPTLNTFALVGTGFDYDWIDNGVLDWVHVISPSMVNDARVGVDYTKIDNGSQWVALGNLATSIGIANGNIVPGIPIFNFQGNGPNIAIGGPSPTAGGTGNGVNQLFADTIIQANDDLTWTFGRHSTHLGFEVFRTRLDTYYSGNPGQLGYINYSGAATSNGTPATGMGVADFFLGLPAKSGRGGVQGTWGQRSWDLAAYVQDDWTATPDLTLNLGLRYDHHTPWIEVFNRQANWNLYTGALETPATFPNRALYNSYNGGWDFQPRIGFAWTPGLLGGNTVLRGGWSISSYLEGTGTNLRLTQNPPFASSLSASPATTESAFSGLATPTDPYLHGDLRVWDPNVRPAISNQYNLTLQHQFGSNDSFQVGYVGQWNRHLMVPMNYAQFQMTPAGVVSPGLYLGEPGGASATIFQVPAGPTGGASTANDGAIARGTASNGNQSYNALQALWLHRSGPFTAQLSYTYSKCMTDSSGYYGSWGGETAPANAYWQDVYNEKAEWGPCYYDVTHLLTGYALYQLPIGRGRSIGHDWSGLTETLLGGWETNAIITLHGGYALTTYSWAGSTDAYGNSPLGAARAMCISPVTYTNTPTAGGLQWFNPASFAPTAANAWGNCSVGDIRGPGMYTLDFALQKNFNFTETRALQFKVESTNLFNTPVLNAPATSTGGGMGVITSSQDARQINFSLKFSF